MNTRIVLFTVMVHWIVSSSVAEPVSRPARSMEYYDLVAKVLVQSVDSHMEHTYHQNPDSQLTGYPLHVELVETLRKTDDVEMSQLLVPAWTLVNGRRYDNPDLEAGHFASPNVVSIACKLYPSEAKWWVVEWVLTDDMWETYRQQKESGVVERPLSQEDYDIQRRLDATRKMKELIKQMEDGEISREDYNLRCAPLMEILSQPIYGSTL